MAVDLGLDTDLAAVKAVSGTDTTWQTKVTAICRKLFHSAANAFGPAATRTTIDADAGMPVGAVCDYISTAVPDNYLPCDGRSLSATAYAALFAVIGTRFGSDGAGTFKLPDFRRRQAVGRSSASPVGAETGAETTIMSVANLPEHGHAVGTLAAAEAGAHDHESAGGYGANSNFAMGVNQTYTAAASPELHNATSIGDTAGADTAGAHSASVASDSAGAHTHAATSGETETAGGSENISVVSPSITMVKCIFTGVA